MVLNGSLIVCHDSEDSSRKLDPAAMKNNCFYKGSKDCLIVSKDPVFLGRSPVANVFVPEPQFDLMLSRFDCITPVADVTANLDTVVSPDGPRLACCRIGLAQHHPASLDS